MDLSKLVKLFIYFFRYIVDYANAKLEHLFKDFQTLHSK